MAKSTEAIPEKTAETAEQRAPRKRVWCVVRIVDYRLQALAADESDEEVVEHEWTDLGGDTMITCDRESAFQLARRHGGLLMSANGLPGPARVGKFTERVKALEAAPF